MSLIDTNIIHSAVTALFPEAVSLLARLVQIDSENNPPHGNEKPVQEFYHNWLRSHDVEAKLIYPTDIPEFTDHPARLSEHEMTNRPNTIATIHGHGHGASLLVLAHADVVPAGPCEAWEYPPFSGRVIDGCLYGRGSGDDKCGMAIAAMLPLVLRHMGIELCGDFTIAALADEEAGGGNGAAALLADGIKADAAIYLDGSNQTIWNVGLGGGFCTLTLTADNKRKAERMAAIARKIITTLKQERRQAIVRHPDFGLDFFNHFFTSEQEYYGVAQNDRYPHVKELIFFLDTLPGEDENVLRQQATTQCRKITEQAGGSMTIRWMSRFLPPCPVIPKHHPLVMQLGHSFKTATNRDPDIGPGIQSDQGLITHYGNIPCVLFGCGRRGFAGAPHKPNEYILLKDFKENFLTMALMLVNWCGIVSRARSYKCQNILAGSSHAATT